MIDDKEELKKFREEIMERMEELAAKDIFPEGFDRPSYEDMKRWREKVRPDMIFCGAPHLLIPHVPLGKGEPISDVNVACAYFELICASRGLGCAMLTFPLGVLNTMPDIKAKLQIPTDHYIPMILGFGYPEIKYHRGVQKEMDTSRIKRPLKN